MTAKLILANPLIDKLIAAGILSEDCSEFILHGKVGAALYLTEGKYVRDTILEIAHHIQVTTDEDEAITGAPPGYKRRKPAA